jgi:hypothetical protein
MVTEKTMNRWNHFGLLATSVQNSRPAFWAKNLSPSSEQFYNGHDCYFGHCHSSQAKNPRRFEARFCLRLQVGLDEESLHRWALQNKPLTVTTSDYVLPTHFHLKTVKISFSEILWDFEPLTSNNSLNIKRFLILPHNCIPPSSPNFKAERQRCWLSLPETMVSSQLTRKSHKI